MAGCLQEPLDFERQGSVASAAPHMPPPPPQVTAEERALGEVSDTGQMDLLRLLATQELREERRV